MRRVIALVAPAALLTAFAGGATPATASTHPRAAKPIAGTYVAVQQFTALAARTVRAGRTVTVQIGGRGGVPASASAVALTVQAIAPTASGALTLFPAGTGRPNTTNLGFAGGHGTTQAAVSRLAGGALTIANRSSGKTEIAVDVCGYYVGGRVDNSEPGVLHMLRSPARAYDTRPSNRYLHGGVVRTFAVEHGVPTSGVGAVAVMVSAISPVRDGSLVAYAAGNDQPTSPTTPFSAGRSNTSFAWVPTKSDGTISVANTSARGTQVVVDVVGWTNAGVAHLAGALQPRFPASLVRNKNVAAGHTLTVPVAGRGGVPLVHVRAAIVSVTVGSPTAQHLVEQPLSRGAIRITNTSRTAVPVSADVVGFVPSTTLAVPPASISRYLGDLNGTYAHDKPIMRNHGCTDAQAIVGLHAPIVLLDIGAQSITGPELNMDDPGVSLTQTSSTVRLDYPALVQVLNSYIDRFDSCADGTAATIALGTNNDGDYSATDHYQPSMRGADWANLVIDMVHAPNGITVVGADDIEAGFASTQAQAQDWESNYLLNASQSHTLIFNGSADGCPDGFGGTHRPCATGWSQQGIYDLAHTVPADSPDGSQILAMPQIYGPSDAAKWTNIDRTGGGHLRFAGVLTEHALDPATYTPSSGWSALRYALGSFIASPSVPAVSDIRNG